MDAVIENAAVEDLPATAPLYTAEQAAAFFNKSVRTWRTWDAAGLTPPPIRIGRSLFWRIDELHAWVAAGCPKRATWNLRKDRQRFP